MESWFNSPARIHRLHVISLSWVGTPFLANSNTRGSRGGVSCQKLASEIYQEVGFAELPVPEVRMAHARFSRVSLVEPFMDDRREFRRLQDFTPEGLMAGDLLGFKIGQVVHHVGILLEWRWPLMFIHTMEHIGTNLANLQDATWSCRLAAVWRPIER